MTKRNRNRHSGAVTILQSLTGQRELIGPIFKGVAALGLDWFSESLERRLRECAETIAEHDAQLGRALRELIEISERQAPRRGDHSRA